MVDDDATFRVMLKTFLLKMGMAVEVAASGKECLKAIEKNKFNLILIDFRLPDINGLELLKEIKERVPHIPLILMTSYVDIRTAVKAIKLGAFEYVTKPLNTDEILLTINNALLKVDKKDSNKDFQHDEHFTYIKGESETADKINHHIDLVAPTNISVIIQGESGTGKEYVSRLLHTKSKRKEKPFIAIDCGALSKELALSELFGHLKGAFTGAIQDKIGQFEMASGGTLFLDEIGNLSYEIQVKLLRAIQERKIRRVGSNTDIDVDVRIIAATNEDLSDFVKAGNFREDLYHRLNEFKIQIPPLRQRGKDIEVFANHFLKVANSELDKNVLEFEPDVMRKFLNYFWPGNLREMKNVIKRSVLLTAGNSISINSLPEEILALNSIKKIDDNLKNEVIYDLKVIAEKNEKELIEATMTKVKYNKTKAAKILNIDRKTLYNKLRLYGFDE